MKKNNKGFSLVELIIVIAIMAILAGALAPALIKYINKSRRSADISNADTIRTAVQTTLSNEEVVDAGVASGTISGTVSEFKGTKVNACFGAEFTSILGSTNVTQKYFNKGQQFYIEMNFGDNTVTVYDKSGGTPISPSN
jgi:type IV pilus assembly protein PilA